MADAASRPLAVAARIATAFEEAGIDYAIGGALALGTWGAQRATKDVDMSVFVEIEAIEPVLDALERAGLMMNRDEMRRDAARLGLLKAQAGMTRVELFLSSHPQYEAMHRRRRGVVEPTSKQTLYFISPEDLCIHKLIYGRDKDVLDLERLAAAQPSVDFAYIRGWLTQMIPEGDRRFAVLDDLERRFSSP